jgi:hypothetical protein
METVEVKSQVSQTLPSQFQINDAVGVHFLYAGKIGAAKITDVRFAKGKVKYDIRICVEPESDRFPGSPALFTHVRGVDSAFVKSRKEWLEYNQSLPEFGMNINETKKLLKEIRDALKWLSVNKQNGFDESYYKGLIERINVITGDEPLNK